MKKTFCTVCSTYVHEPCTDPDCPINDDLDRVDEGREDVAELDFSQLDEGDYHETAFYDSDFVRYHETAFYDSDFVREDDEPE